jgi:hypothetical protein
LFDALEQMLEQSEAEETFAFGLIDLEILDIFSHVINQSTKLKLL